MAKAKEDTAKAKEDTAKVKEDTPKKEDTAKAKKAAPAKAASAKSAAEKTGPVQPARLQQHFREAVVPALMKQFGYKTAMQVPRIDKIVLNMGVGEAVNDKKILDNAVGDMTRITGQKPVVTKARKSIAGFKLREGMAIGAKVTLRGDRMWEFLDRLLSTALPRIRDFRGLNPDQFDGHGNYTIGVTEQLIFPEIDYDKVVKVRGMDITVVTTARTDDEGRALLQALGFPFQGMPAVSAGSAES